MEQKEEAKPVLVTGGSGYIASWIIKLFLEKGFPVRTTVRNLAQKERVNHLLEIAEASSGTLTLYEADLLKDGSFSEAMAGCEAVVHTASPFFLYGIKNPREQLIEPALQGTRNVLTSAGENASVRRVVLTSSVVAIYGDASDIRDTPAGIFTEKEWNTSSSEKHQPYSYSKMLAEQEAWKMAAEQKQWDLVVLNPGFVLGPSLTKRKDSFSIDFMISMLNGKYKIGVPDLHFGIVDVRDVAKAHFLATTTPQASGRHILVAGIKTTLEIATILRQKFGDKYPLPKMTVPKFLSYLVGPFFGLKWKFISKNVGIALKFDNSYSQQDLGLEYRPLETTLHDQAAQIIKDQLI
ncbi:SDR family oxidoreductase [candidate division CSSED10-310 bacterium]|uniref:SDR family oxidoreductase n=1 Tax=candidate division CSSED10-310 bacterium TaxID=2855610 RepID=A0ABV6YRA3_UNCC1